MDGGTRRRASARNICGRRRPPAVTPSVKAYSLVATGRAVHPVVKREAGWGEGETD